MTRHLELHHPYPLPTDQLRDALTAEDYLRARLTEFGGPGATLVSRTVTGQRIVIVERLSVPKTDLPPLARRFVRGDLHITRIEVWNGPTDGNTEITSNAPGAVKGTLLITPQGTGSLLTVRLSASVKVPFLGGKIEKALLEKVDELDETEHQFTLRWLDRRP